MFSWHYVERTGKHCLSLMPSYDNIGFLHLKGSENKDFYYHDKANDGQKVNVNDIPLEILTKILGYVVHENLVQKQRLSIISKKFLYATKMLPQEQIFLRITIQGCLDNNYTVSYRKLDKALGLGSDVISMLQRKVPKEEKPLWNAFIELNPTSLHPSCEWYNIKRIFWRTSRKTRSIMWKRK